MKGNWTDIGYDSDGVGNAVVLLGNGLTWASEGPSWSDLLNKLKKTAYYKGDLDNEKPFPLIFEEIYLHGLRSGVKENDLLNTVSHHCESLSAGSLHEEFSNLPLNHLITTNYDHVTALSFLKTSKLTNAAPINETRYSLFRQHESGKRVVWPIHGTQDSIQSIMLGYEHYCGYLEQMRRYVTRGVTYKKKWEPGLVKRLSDGEQLIKSWLDFFFTKRVIVLGLNLDLHEIHLWWLLTYRARRQAEGKLFVKGDIYFLSRKVRESDFKSHSEYLKNKAMMQRKHDLLKAAGVNVVIIEENDQNNPKVHYSAALKKTEKLISQANQRLT